MPAEVNNPPCPLHGAPPRSLYTHNFLGIVQAAEAILTTVSGLGTTSYTRCPYGYPSSFEGVVRVLEDLNATVSGLSGGLDNIAAGSGIYFTASGTSTVINATVVSASGVSITAGSGIYLSDAGTRINLNAVGADGVGVSYSGTTALISGAGSSFAVVSGSPGDDYRAGSLWFDTSQGRLFVYASGNDVSDPDWYQANSDTIVAKGNLPPSGTGPYAPPRDGTVWFSTMLGSLFVYDVASSGWYEAGPSRSFAYGAAAPAPSVQGAGWYSTSDNTLKVWDGTAWITV